jgi:hypothetical protein
MAVEVGVRDLVRSYAVLRDSATAQVNSASRLLQFYSVECGLKAAILGKNGSSARGTQDLRDDLRTHDLRTLAKELRLGASVAKDLVGCRRRHDPRERVEPHQLHEAWRYGAALQEDDEKAADGVLSQLSEWCRREHAR